MKNIPGVDASTGSLGQGLSIANGMALGSKQDSEGVRVYCICGKRHRGCNGSRKCPCRKCSSLMPGMYQGAQVIKDK